MLYNKSVDEAKISFFLNLLFRIISGNDIAERPYVDEIIRDVHYLAINQKNFYNISRDGYPIIIHLYEVDKDYFHNLSVDSLSNDVYEQVYKLLSEQPEFAQ